MQRRYRLLGAILLYLPILAGVFVVWGFMIGEQCSTDTSATNSSHCDGSWTDNFVYATTTYPINLWALLVPLPLVLIITIAVAVLLYFICRLQQKDTTDHPGSTTCTIMHPMKPRDCCTTTTRVIYSPMGPGSNADMGSIDVMLFKASHRSGSQTS